MDEVANSADGNPLNWGDGPALTAARQTMVVIEPRQLIRECLKLSLSAASRDHEVVAFSSVGEWKASTGGHAQGDVVVLYDPQPLSRGVKSQTLLSLAGVGDAMRVVLICDTEDPDEILEFINDGVRGVIPTSVSLKVVIEAIRLVWAGGIFIPAGSLLQRRASREEAVATAAERMFTPRQAAVLEQLQKGKANKIIAYDLQMKESTVKVHIRNIMRKVGATNRTEVAIRDFGFGAAARPVGRAGYGLGLPDEGAALLARSALLPVSSVAAGASPRV